MATARELKALITLAGRVDPSLQKSLLDAANKTKGLSKEMGLGGLAAKTAGQAWASARKKASELAAATSKKLPIIGQLTEAAKKSKLLQASLVTLGNGGKKALGLLKVGAKATVTALAGLATAGAAAFVALGKKGYQVASDLVEVQNVVDVTFGDGSKKIDSWSQSLLKGYGLSELSAKSYSSTLGAMLKSSGLVGNDMMAMSQNLTMLTGDMASFYNLQPDEMFAKIRSGISGETEPLKQLGINMSVANLEAYALSQGIKKSYSNMSQAEQVTLRYNYLLQATADAQGDFSRNIDSASNQQKLLTESLSQFAGRVMQNVLPAAVQLMQGLNGMMDGMDTQHLGQFAAKMADLVVQIMPLAMELLPVVSDILMTIGPPLLEIIRLVLPPATKFLKLAADVLGKLLRGGAGVVSKLLGLSKGEDTSGGLGLAKYARGGFSARPAIFGEAGLEAAIPIKRNNPRSLSLLSRTAQMLGVGHWIGDSQRKGRGTQGADLLQRTARMQAGNWFGGITLNYAPVLHGGDPEALQPILRKQYQDIRAMLEEYRNRQRRLMF